MRRGLAPSRRGFAVGIELTMTESNEITAIVVLPAATHFRVRRSLSFLWSSLAAARPNRSSRHRARRCRTPRSFAGLAARFRLLMSRVSRANRPRIDGRRPSILADPRASRDETERNPDRPSCADDGDRTVSQWSSSTTSSPPRPSGKIELKIGDIGRGGGDRRLCCRIGGEREAIASADADFAGLGPSAFSSTLGGLGASRQGAATF